MRAPRYRFPDEVRTATRGIASRMVADGTCADSPEQLDAWLAAAPEVRETLERGGYGTAFTAQDLFPLLQVFMTPRAESPGPAVRAVTPSRRWWLIGLFLLLLVVLVVVLFAPNPLPPR